VPPSSFPDDGGREGIYVGMYEGMYVCDKETPKRETKGPSWTISACE
jgi:hypothetical protein